MTRYVRFYQPLNELASGDALIFYDAGTAFAGLFDGQSRLPRTMPVRGLRSVPESVRVFRRTHSTV